MASSKSAEQIRKPPAKRNSQAKSKNKRAQKDTVKSQDDEILTLENAGCPVCMDGVMIEPVTLPCSHRLCHACYKSCVELSNLTCPNCRKYIGGFSRKTAKGNKAIDTALWERFQAQFPKEIKLQLETKIENGGANYVPVEDNIYRQIAEPGELKKELEKQLIEEARLEEERRLKEEKASASILAELEKEQAEEMAREAERERIRIQDEAFALELSRQDNPSTVSTPPSTRKRLRSASDSLNTPAAKKISAFFQNRSVSNGNKSRESSGSSDFASTSRTPHPRSDSLTTGGRSSSGSIDDELLPQKVLFRPIRSAPLTPPKQQTNGGIVKPQVVAGTSRTLDFLPEVDEPIAADVNHNNTSMTNNEPVPKEGGLWAELLKEELDRQKRQEEADRKLARQLQKELDAEERPHLIVNRSKGSQDQYLLRANKKLKTDKKQSTIEDSFQRPSQRSTSPQP